MKSMHTALLSFGLVAMAGIGCASVCAQTSISASVYGAFNGTTTGDGVAQSPSNAARVMLGVRHISNPLIGYEGTYSYNHANQTYTPTVSCGIPCGSDVPASISAAAHEVRLTGSCRFGWRTCVLSCSVAGDWFSMSPAAGRRKPAARPSLCLFTGQDLTRG